MMHIFKKKALPSSNSVSNSEKIALHHQLTFKLTFRVGLLIIIILAALSFTISYFVSGMIQRNTDSIIAYTAKHNANLAAEYLSNLQARAHSLSLSLSPINDLKIDQADKEQLTKEIMNNVLEDQRIFSVYTAWEPNMAFADTPEGLSFYYYREGNEITLDVLNDYNDYSKADYYAISKENRKPHITEPYLYTLSNGHDVWMITISNPILSSTGQVLGVANCDILMETISGLDYDTGNYTNSQTAILSNEGIYLANSYNPELIGKLFTDGLEGEQLTSAQGALTLMKNGEQKSFKSASVDTGAMSYVTLMPLNIEGIDKPLSSTFVVDVAEAHREMYTMMWSILGISASGLLILILSMIFFIRSSLKPMGSILQLAENIQNGNLHTDIQVNSKDELGHLAQTFGATTRVLQSYIKEISTTLSTLASGDLRISIENEYNGDFAPIKAALIQISQSFNDTLALIGSAADQVNAGAAQISSSAQVLASGAAEQAATIEQLNDSITTVAIQAKENAHNVQKVTGMVLETGASISESDQYMDKLSSAMEDMGKASAQIAGITKLIDDIAFQTNILALNAAIEAASAGSAGKGFAVVADEVRSLAAKSSEAAKRTGELVYQSTTRISEGVKITEDTSRMLKKAVEQTANINQTIWQIDTATNQQAEAIEQITNGISQVSSVVHTNAATAEESSASSEELSAQAQLLWQEVHKFKLAEQQDTTFYVESRSVPSSGSFASRKW